MTFFMHIESKEHQHREFVLFDRSSRREQPAAPFGASGTGKTSVALQPRRIIAVAAVPKHVVEL